MKNILEMTKYELLEVVDTTKDIKVLKEIVNTTYCNISVVRECVRKLIELEYKFEDLVFVVNVQEILKEFKDYCVLSFCVYNELIQYLNKLKEEDTAKEEEEEEVDTFYYSHSKFELEEVKEIHKEYEEERKKQEELV